ncbi:MAG: phosphoserine phosphatase [Solimicrobium sp.]|jgi:HAD superfamily hydrolase (TIGR01490 family)|nr:phosphoserine phosphatase [Solimicrobium sp.]
MSLSSPFTPARIAIFDLDHTLIPIDSDYEWGQFLCRIGAVDKVSFEERNNEFFAQYQTGCLDPYVYLEFSLESLASFSSVQLRTMRDQFMQEVINPVLLPTAKKLLAQHQNDLVVIITATHRFVTEPIAQAFGVEHLIAAQPEITPDGRLTGKFIGTPTYGIGKVEHLNNWLEDRKMTLTRFEKSYFYSDSHNDLPLLKLVSNPVATNPNPQLTKYAQLNSWPILKIFND